MLATAEHATDIDRPTSRAARRYHIALIESHSGYNTRSRIARAMVPFRLAFGAGDYRRDTAPPQPHGARLRAFAAGHRLHPGWSARPHRRPIIELRW